ncbi:hypothetical protein ABIA73_003002 [Stenotrophomonas sp. 2694]
MRCARFAPNVAAQRSGPPFAGLSPPLSGQPLNRGACSPRYGSRSTPCVDDRRNRVRPGSTACRGRAGQQPFFNHLAGDATRVPHASPQTLLRNVRPPPFAGLSPPLSGQPLNRRACSPRYGSRSTPCVDDRRNRVRPGSTACRDRAGQQPFLLIWLGTRSALRALRPKRCCATFGPLPSPASPRPCRGSPSTEGLVPPAMAVDPRHAWMPRPGRIDYPPVVEPVGAPRLGALTFR